jgi:DNA-binding response OmpR family regulator
VTTPAKFCRFGLALVRPRAAPTDPITMDDPPANSPPDEVVPCCVLAHATAGTRYDRIRESLPGDRIETVHTIEGVRAFLASNALGLVLVTQNFLDRRDSWDGAAEVVRLCREDLHPVMLVLEDAAPSITVARGFDYGFDDVVFTLSPSHEIAARVRRASRAATAARWLRDRQGIDPDTNLMTRATATHFLIGSLSYARRTGVAVSISSVRWTLETGGKSATTPEEARTIRKRVASVLSGVLRPYDSVFAMNDRCFLIIWTDLPDAHAPGVNSRIAQVLRDSGADDSVTLTVEWHVPPHDLDRYPEKIPGYLDGLTACDGRAPVSA